MLWFCSKVYQGEDFASCIVLVSKSSLSAKEKRKKEEKKVSKSSGPVWYINLRQNLGRYITLGFLLKILTFVQFNNLKQTTLKLKILSFFLFSFFFFLYCNCKRTHSFKSPVAFTGFQTKKWIFLPHFLSNQTGKIKK